MLIVTTLSVVFATASLFGSSYIFLSTITVACRGLCCSVDEDGPSKNERQEMVQRILCAISFADLLASACWISTQVQELSGLPDVPIRCMSAGIIGQFSFIAMSMWTAVFASCTRAVLTQGTTVRVVGGGWIVSVAIWSVSAVSTAVLYVGHSSCRDHRGSGSGVHAPWLMLQVQRQVWRVCFVGLPLGTVLLCLTEYARVSCYYRKQYALSAGDLEEHLTSFVSDTSTSGAHAAGAHAAGSSGGNDRRDNGDGNGDGSAAMPEDSRAEELGSRAHESGSVAAHGRISKQALRELRARGLRFSLSLNRRLLSYLLAYVLCEAPGLPNALQQAFSAADGDYLDDGYLELEETSPIVAMRVLAQSLQGLANAIVFAHHTGKLNGCIAALRWHWHAAWRRSTECTEEM